MEKHTFKFIHSAEDADADLYQTSLIPTADDKHELPTIVYKVTEILFNKSTFNIETGTKIIVVRAKRWRKCLYGWNQTYSIKNPTWDGNALGLTMYDVENNRCVHLQFMVTLDMNPRIDSLFSSEPVLE